MRTLSISLSGFSSTSTLENLALSTQGDNPNVVDGVLKNSSERNNFKVEYECHCHVATSSFFAYFLWIMISTMQVDNYLDNALGHQIFIKTVIHILQDHQPFLRLNSHQVGLLLSSIWAQATTFGNSPANFEAMAHSYKIALMYTQAKVTD